MTMITDDTKEMELFTGKAKKISWERLWTFSGGAFKLDGWPSRNTHTDIDFAKGVGLPTAIASATQHMGYIVQLMIDLFGTEWLYYGNMDVKFIDIVGVGDVVVPKAMIKSKEVSENDTKFILNVWCENQRGEKVLVGSATGITGEVQPRDTKEYESRVADLKSSNAIKKAAIERTEFEPLEYVVTPELNQQFLYGEEDFHPRYIENMADGPPIAHPALLLNWSNGSRSPSASASSRMPSGQAGLHARDEVFFCNPARVGKKLKVTWNMTGSYEKRGRTYSVTETMITDEDNLEIMKRLTYVTMTSKELVKDYKR